MRHLNQRSASSGFTLIELLIGITIVAILVAMALPAYKNYTVKAKVAECINNSAVAKVQISEYKQTLGPWPPTQADAGLTASGLSLFCAGFVNYTSSYGSFTIDVDENAIDLSIAGQISPVMTPTPTSGNIINWDCSPGTTGAANIKYLPATCRSS